MKLGHTFCLVILFAGADSHCETLPVHVFDCVVSLPNVTDVTVSVPNRVTFSFRDTESDKIVSMNIMEYSGDKAWNGPDSERTTITRSKIYRLDERVISVRQTYRESLTAEQLTDKKTAVLFTPKIDLSKYLTCDARTP